jgi:tetratricopeptide (TPR) repeat protein
MGLLFFALLAAILFAALLWRARPTRPAATAIAAALLLAGVGYAWQGRPFLPGRPAAASPARSFADPLFAAERRLWLGSVGPEADQLAGADTLIAGGSADYAVGVLRGAVARTPNDMALWIGLGHALVAYADGAVTPAARFCFARAAAIAPRHPAPRYFLGLALLTGGDIDGAERLWRALLADLPADGGPHRLLEARLGTLARLRAVAGR